MPLNYRDVDLLPRLVQQYDIRAINSQRHSAICFQNKCDVEVEVQWIDYESNIQSYRTLKPGESYNQRTFVTHPWSFIEKGTGKAKVVENKAVYITREEALLSEPIIAEICEPSSIPWAVNRHHLFAPEFQTWVQGFLLACVSDARVPRSKAETPSLGDLPSEIILKIISNCAPYLPRILPPCVGEGVDRNVPSHAEGQALALLFQ